MRRRALMVVSVVSVALVLGGCSLLNPGPARDGNGRVTGSSTISARDLTKGDCFTFNSDSGGIVDQVTVMPCSHAHDYLTIGQGTLTPGDIKSAGSMQDAVSAACAPVFDAFKAATKGDTKPKQQFLVFPETDKPDSVQLYSCIATDPDQSATASTPAP